MHCLRVRSAAGSNESSVVCSESVLIREFSVSVLQSNKECAVLCSQNVFVSCVTCTSIIDYQ